MTLSRRSALRLGLGAGAVPLLGRLPIPAPETAAPRRTAERGVIWARPLPLSAVRLTGGPLKHAQELDRQYLLALEPDRMLAYYRQRAGRRVGRRRTQSHRAHRWSSPLGREPDVGGHG